MSRLEMGWACAYVCECMWIHMFLLKYYSVTAACYWWSWAASTSFVVHLVCVAAFRAATSLIVQFVCVTAVYYRTATYILGQLVQTTAEYYNWSSCSSGFSNWMRTCSILCTSHYVTVYLIWKTAMCIIIYITFGAAAQAAAWLLCETEWLQGPAVCGYTCLFSLSVEQLLDFCVRQNDCKARLSVVIPACSACLWSSCLTSVWDRMTARPGCLWLYLPVQLVCGAAAWLLCETEWLQGPAVCGYTCLFSLSVEQLLDFCVRQNDCKARLSVVIPACSACLWSSCLTSVWDRMTARPGCLWLYLPVQLVCGAAAWLLCETEWLQGPAVCGYTCLFSLSVEQLLDFCVRQNDCKARLSVVIPACSACLWSSCLTSVWDRMTARPGCLWLYLPVQLVCGAAAWLLCETEWLQGPAVCGYTCLFSLSVEQLLDFCVRQNDCKARLSVVIPACSACLWSSCLTSVWDRMTARPGCLWLYLPVQLVCGAAAWLLCETEWLQGPAVCGYTCLFSLSVEQLLVWLFSSSMGLWCVSNDTCSFTVLLDFCQSVWDRTTVRPGCQWRYECLLMWLSSLSVGLR